jgi:thiol:disulfide interchange protein DsbD
VTLKLPAAAVTTAAAPATAAPVAPASAAADAEPIAEQDRIAAMLQRGSVWLIIGSFFGIGLLLAFTPCVFPMIPILSGIIAGQGRHITARKGFVLSLVYVLAMALTYTVAGVLAGLFGENLQAAFQNPWIIGLFAAVFVALSLSMFGFYELQLPSALQSRLSEISNRQEGGNLAGVAIMGLLSALIVGPCVAPPLAGALIYIGQTGDAVLGGLALFALSLGMGAPLIAIGTSAGKLLPRAGAWMDAIKAVFGVLMLAVAIYLLERVIPEALAMLLWGALLIVSGVFLGAFQHLPIEATGWRKLWKGLGVILVVYGALMLVGAAAGGRDTLQPLRGVVMAGPGGGAVEKASFRPIKTVADLDRELAAAKAAGKPVMLDFYADWCVYCKQLERDTFPDPAVQQVLSAGILLKADVTANDEADKALLAHLGIPAPPAMIFYGADGIERRNSRLLGFMAAKEFADHVRVAWR